jgi:hypothetical protein
MHVTGLTSHTICNGDLVYENGIITSTPGSGQYLKREPFGYAFSRTAALTRKRDPRNFVVDRSGTPEPEAPTVEKFNTL